jgi:hypothetical protein
MLAGAQATAVMTHPAVISGLNAVNTPPQAKKGPSPVGGCDAGGSLRYSGFCSGNQVYDAQGRRELKEGN